MEPDYIDGKILYEREQIEARLEDVKAHYGEGRWLTCTEVAEHLKITKSKSALTMIGHAVRNHPGVKCKRTQRARVFTFIPAS